MLESSMTLHEMSENYHQETNPKKAIYITIYVNSRRDSYMQPFKYPILFKLVYTMVINGQYFAFNSLHSISRGILQKNPVSFRSEIPSQIKESLKQYFTNYMALKGYIS